MGKVPKRRKDKHNPYKIHNHKNICIIEFKQKNELKKIEVTKEIFNLFNEYELQDLREMNEYDNHIEHSELCESTLYRRALKQNEESIEEKIIKKEMYESLHNAIKQLKSPQRERIIMYFFKKLNLEEIAKKEGCTKVAVKYSIDRGLINLKTILKKRID